MGSEKVAIFIGVVMSRYKKSSKAINNLDFYKKEFEARGVKRIEQFRTPILKKFNTKTVPYVERTWKDGDLFWKLSNEYYGDPQYWYIIARFNNAPTEAHLSVGDLIKIPMNISLALQVVA
jgi:nucleoid-associated protein YgaU